MGYLTGEKEAPAVDDPAYVTWDAENSMVMTWLVNSIYVLSTGTRALGECKSDVF